MLHGIKQCKNKVIKTIYSSSIVYTAMPWKFLNYVEWFNFLIVIRKTAWYLLCHRNYTSE